VILDTPAWIAEVPNADTEPWDSEPGDAECAYSEFAYPESGYAGSGAIKAGITEPSRNESGKPTPHSMSVVDTLAILTNALRSGRLPETTTGLAQVISACESLKAQAFGIQALAMVEFERATKHKDAAAGKAARDQGRGVTRQLGKLVNGNDTFASTLLRNSRILTEHMPYLYDQVRQGCITERRIATIIREARSLHNVPWWEIEGEPPIASMTVIDRRLAATTADILTTRTCGIRTLERRVRSLVEELHPDNAEERLLAEKHASSYVDVRDIGHGMSELIARMETAHAAAIYTHLSAMVNNGMPANGMNANGMPGSSLPSSSMNTEGMDASAQNPSGINASGTNTEMKNISGTHTGGLKNLRGTTTGFIKDVYPRGLMMATALYELVTGQFEDEPRVTIDLVISDETLLAGGSDPAIVLADNARKNVGTIPAHVARTLAANAIDSGTAWLQKLYANPHGTLVAASSKERFFPPGLARVIRLRDHATCREPGCGAAIKHLDHVQPWRDDGPTTFQNGQGLCARHNLNKEAHAWVSTSGVDALTKAHRVETTDPLGYTTYNSPPPLPLPSRLLPCDARCEQDTALRDHLSRTATRIRPGYHSHLYPEANPGCPECSETAFTHAIARATERAKSRSQGRRTVLAA
jgi:hypothetical protein